MNCRKIIIPVQKNKCGYTEYCRFIRPYLDVFGMPYDEVEITDLEGRLSDGCALVLLAQKYLEISKSQVNAITEAAKGGAGIVCTDGSILACCGFDEFSVHNVVNSTYYRGNKIIISADEYITRFHKSGEEIALYDETCYFCVASLKEGRVLAKICDAPLLEVSEYNGIKVVLWHDTAWINPFLLGPVHGMDDIFREAIVWAAKKPFAMKSMPGFVGMRVDDVWGAWRDKTPENPVSWIDTSNKYGFKPWLGVFTDNIDEKSTELVHNYVKDGIATAFPHGFSGCKWVGSDLPENFAYFDHFNQRPYTDRVMKENAERIKGWFDEKDIPVSKLALAHYYEVGENALPYLLEWGCEFVGVHMPNDAHYRSFTGIKCGPYRKYSALPPHAARPVYYADYLEFPNNPEIDRKLFNCVTEIRDVRGYELKPSNDVENTVDSGVRQLRRAILSGIPAVLFTHESCWIQQITPENWEAEMAGITEGIADLNPVFETMDNICKYVRANHDIAIESAIFKDDGKLEITVCGNNDMETKFVVYGDEGGKITENWYDLPIVDKEITVNV